MANGTKKHQRRKVHFGDTRGTACGLPWPRFGAGITDQPAKVTCQACASQALALKRRAS